MVDFERSVVVFFSFKDCKQFFPSFRQTEHINCSRRLKMYHSFLFSAIRRFECYKLQWRVFASHQVHVVVSKPFFFWRKTHRSETTFQVKMEWKKERKKTFEFVKWKRTNWQKVVWTLFLLVHSELSDKIE